MTYVNQITKGETTMNVDDIEARMISEVERYYTAYGWPYTLDQLRRSFGHYLKKLNVVFFTDYVEKMMSEEKIAMLMSPTGKKIVMPWKEWKRIDASGDLVGYLMQYEQTAATRRHRVRADKGVRQ